MHASKHYDEIKNSETLSVKTIINKFHLQERTVIIQENFRKKYLQLFATKLTEITPNHSNAKDYYSSYLKRENTKLVKQSKIIAQQLKAIKAIKHC